MKNLFIILTLTLVFLFLSSNAAVNDSIIVKNNTKPITFHLNAGTSFISPLKNSEGVFSSYIAPQFSYTISKKIIFDAGFAVVKSNLKFKNHSNNESINKVSPANYASTYVYFGAKYLLSNKIIISGQTFSQVGAFTNATFKENNSNYNFKGTNLGIDYQFNDNASIGFRFNYSNIESNNNPYSYQNPFDYK